MGRMILKAIAVIWLMPPWAKNPLRSANARGQRRSNLAPVNAEQAGSGSAPIQNAQIRALRGRHPHAPVGRTERRLGMSQAAGSAARGDLQAKAKRWRKLRT
jgi:hypothetical protein